MRRLADRARTFSLPAGAGVERGPARRPDGSRRRFRDALCGRTGRQCGIAGAHFGGAALCGGRPLSLARAKHERRDFASQPQRRRGIHFTGRGSHARHAGCTAYRPWPVRPRSCRRSSGLSHGAVGCRARQRATRRIPFAPRRGSWPEHFRRFHLGRDALPAARAGFIRGRCRRRDARRHRPQGPGAGPRTGAHRRRAGGCLQDPVPGHHEPRIAHAAERHHRLLRDDRA